MAGVAVTDALIRVCGLPATLKWPNDVLVPAPPNGAESKVAGLLAEVVANKGVVVGLGLNVSQDVDELPVPTATSLRLAGSATTDRDTVVRAVLRALSERYRAFVDADRPGAGATGLAAVYRERCSTLGRTVQVHLPDETVVTGQAEGVDDQGRLLLRTQAQTRTLSVGDVVHIRPVDPS
jgi:BirA family biotin operon repressor/biotin-[acetyl-CoA-carboxylase] ligase